MSEDLPPPARTSLNAIKHGGRSQQILLPHEDPDKWKETRDIYLEEFDPQTSYTQRLVDDAAAAIVHLLSLDAPDALYVGVDDTPLPVDELYDYLAGLLGAAPPPDGPSAPGIGNKRMSNAHLRATGFQCRWPDARMGYAALL